MANVVDTKLYDILGVSPSASENELKKVGAVLTRREVCATQDGPDCSIKRPENKLT